MIDRLQSIAFSIAGGSRDEDGDDEDTDDSSTDDRTKAEYVYAMLRENGGRVRQQTLVSNGDWSPATISRALSELEERGHVERLSDGREKIVCAANEAN